MDRAMSGCDGSDLPALQPSQEFASSLVERLGRRDRLCANSPWCSCDTGWQRLLAPELGQVPAERKAGKGEPHSQAVEPKSEVPIVGVEPVPPHHLPVPGKPHLSSRPHEMLTSTASTFFLEERAVVSCCCDPRHSSEKLKGLRKGHPS